MQQSIPPPKKAKPTPLERRVVWCVRRGDRWLIEQRPAAGRWAGMWQFVTRPRPGRGEPPPAPPVPVGKVRRLGRVEHGLTHRRYEFDVRWADAAGDGNGDGEVGGGDGTGAPAAASPAADRPHAWVTLDGLADYPLPKPHLTVAGMLRGLAAPPSRRGSGGSAPRGA